MRRHCYQDGLRLLSTMRCLFHHHFTQLQRTALFNLSSGLLYPDPDAMLLEKTKRRCPFDNTSPAPFYKTTLYSFFDERNTHAEIIDTGVWQNLKAFFNLNNFIAYFVAVVKKSRRGGFFILFYPES